MANEYNESKESLTRALDVEKFLAKIDRVEDLKAVVLIYKDGACIFSQSEFQELRGDAPNNDPKCFKYYFGFPPGRRP